MYGRAVFEVIEVKRGCMVKERNFEAEKKCKKFKYPTLFYVILPFSY
jgi:hypothetical protein